MKLKELRITNELCKDPEKVWTTDQIHNVKMNQQPNQE